MFAKPGGCCVAAAGWAEWIRGGGGVVGSPVERVEGRLSPSCSLRALPTRLRHPAEQRGLWTEPPRLRTEPPSCHSGAAPSRWGGVPRALRGALWWREGRGTWRATPGPRPRPCARRMARGGATRSPREAARSAPSAQTRQNPNPENPMFLLNEANGAISCFGTRFREFCMSVIARICADKIPPRDPQNPGKTRKPDRPRFPWQRQKPEIPISQAPKTAGFVPDFASTTGHSKPDPDDPETRFTRKKRGSRP